MTIAATRTMSVLGLALTIGSSGPALPQQNDPASSITIKWASPHDDKKLTIESGAAKLYEEKLEGDGLQVAVEPMIGGGTAAATLPATVSIEDFDELAIGVNLFRCSSSCAWRITFTEFAEKNSKTINKICQGDPKSLDTQYKKYFFCRDSYRKYVEANDKCWDITLTALTGWFEAAYKIHELTLKDGVGFFARDTDVEQIVNESLSDCPGFEKLVRRNNGYFKGMIRNLNIAVLQQTQRVEKALNADKADDARIIAEEVVQQLEVAEPVREAIPAKDASYIESIINRALPRDALFSLR